MKRDLELIRKILVVLEDKRSTIAEELPIDGYDENIVAFHINLLIEAGFVKGVLGDELNGAITAYASSMTWAGYEFLDVSRNDTAWLKAKKVLKEKSISVSVSILTKLLTMYVEDSLKPS
jgi:hypothetical protein